MPEFKMNRNGSGYYDETAYNGLNGMVKEGEVWTCTNNLNSIPKEFLIIKNHGTFCTALLMVDECNSDRIRVEAMHGAYEKFTDPRLVQYIYNSNMCKHIATIPPEQFEDIKGEIYLALQMDVSDQPEEVEDLPLEFDPAISDMVALFGADVVKGFLKCGVYLNKVSGNEILAGEYMSKLLELEEGVLDE